MITSWKKMEKNWRQQNGNLKVSMSTRNRKHIKYLFEDIKVKPGFTKQNRWDPNMLENLRANKS